MTSGYMCYWDRLYLMA